MFTIRPMIQANVATSAIAKIANNVVVMLFIGFVG
jgi:hypothetical protein